MDARLRYLLRTFTAEPSESNAMQLAIAMARSHAQIQVRTHPLTHEEILRIPLNADGSRTVEGNVRVDFNSLWEDVPNRSIIDLEYYLDAVSAALVGNDYYLTSITASIIDVEPGEKLIIHVSGDLERDLDEPDDDDIYDSSDAEEEDD
jgi:hypothetical protein